MKAAARLPGSIFAFPESCVGLAEKGKRNPESVYRTGRQPKTLQGGWILASGDLVSFVFALEETELSCYQLKKKRVR